MCVMPYHHHPSLSSHFLFTLSSILRFNVWLEKWSNINLCLVQKAFLRFFKDMGLTYILYIMEFSPIAKTFYLLSLVDSTVHYSTKEQTMLRLVDDIKSTKDEWRKCIALWFLCGALLLFVTILSCFTITVVRHFLEDFYR